MSTEVNAISVKRSPGGVSAAVAWWVLAASGIITLVGGALHPQVDTSLSYTGALIKVFHDGAWPVTHALQLVGLVALVVGLLWVRSAEGPTWSNVVRGWVVALTCAAVLAVVEMIPHLLVYRQVDDLARTGSSTLLDVHTTIQAFSASLLGLTFAGVAITTARRREFGNGAVMAVLAVLGGVAYALAGILMAVLKKPALSPLFLGEAGLAIWLLVGSVRRALRVRSSATA